MQVMIQRAKHVRKPVVSVSNTVKARRSKPRDVLEAGVTKATLLPRISDVGFCVATCMLSTNQQGFAFSLGQAVELAVDQPGWSDDKHPFTMTNLPDNPRLEFIIKSYPVAQNPKHDGMTEHFGRDIEIGDGVLFGDA